MLHLKIEAAYEYIFKNIKRNFIKIDDDSLLDVNKFLNYDFNFDYGGFIVPGLHSNYTYHSDKVTDHRFDSPITDTPDTLPYGFAHGGGYYMSLKAQEIFLKNCKTSKEYNNHLSFKKGREDRLVGQTLTPFFKKLKIQNSGYYMNDEILYSALDNIVFHPFSAKKLEILYTKKHPKYWLNRIWDDNYLMMNRDMNTIIEEFFNSEKPCPPEVPMCDKVRQAYKDELDKASSSGCSQCAKNGIKSRFMEAIWKEAVQSLISKAS
jgi:hypothetical protein